MVHWKDQYLTKSEARKRVVQGKNVYTDHLIIISWWKGNNVTTCKSNLVWTQWHYRHLVILLEKISVCARSRSLQDLHCSLWFAERVFRYWMSIGTSIHSGQQHQCRGKWVFYLSEATLKYIEDFISPFWWGVLFCNSFITVSETSFTCQKNRGCRTLTLLCVSWPRHYRFLFLCNISRWHTHPRFPLFYYACVCLNLFWLCCGSPGNCHFAPIDRIQTHLSSSAGKSLDSQPMCFSTTFYKQIRW